MPTLASALRETPKPVLYVLAEAWEIDADSLDEADLVRALTRTMTNTHSARAVIDALGDKERSALRMLLNERNALQAAQLAQPSPKGARNQQPAPAAREAKMPENKFTPLYGRIRGLGEDQIKSEQPLENSTNSAEALYYRGLLFKGFETVETGARVIVFIADELIDIIEPLTTYKVVHDLDEDEEEDEDDGYDSPPTPTPAVPSVEASKRAPKAAQDTGREIAHDAGRDTNPEAAKPSARRAPAAKPARSSAPAEKPIPAPARTPASTPAPLREADTRQNADTSIVDDLTTLLAYISLYEPELNEGSLGEAHMERLSAALLNTDPLRLLFLLDIAYGMGMIDVQAGRIVAKLADARVWLGAPRWDQIRRLAEAWRESSVHVELRHLPGLVPETIDGYLPAAVRGVILGWMRRVLPLGDWWSIPDFIAYLKAESPDYQRPNGDFNVWYIRDASGHYLNGIESWDAIDGALLHHLITRPMHWLALVDLGTMNSPSAETAHLTAYGRAFISGSPFPQPAEQTDRIEVQVGGTILVSRKVSRADRLQIARFTSWNPLQAGVNAVYSYGLNSQGIQIAAERGIGTPRIAAFLVAALGDSPLPPPVAALLEKWKHGAAAACSVERLLVLRTPSEEMLDLIYDTPALRRFVGARLGADAAVVRADMAEGLRDALGMQGVQVDWMDS